MVKKSSMFLIQPSASNTDLRKCDRSVKARSQLQLLLRRRLAAGRGELVLVLLHDAHEVALLGAVRAVESLVANHLLEVANLEFGHVDRGQVHLDLCVAAHTSTRHEEKEQR